MGGETDLHRAAQQGRLARALALLDAGADPNALNDRRETPIFSAIADPGGEKLVEALISAQADVSIANNFGDTPLHAAAIAGRESAVHLLLRAGAAIDSSNLDGKLPRDVASSDRVREILEERAAEKRKKATAGLKAVCLAVIGRHNNPLYFATFREEHDLEFQYLIHASLDVIEERVSDRSRPGLSGEMYLGLLHVTDEYRVYGFISNTRQKFVLMLEDEDYREADMKTFFRRVHYYFTNASFNPFCMVKGRMLSPQFDRAVEVIRTRMFR